MCSPCCCSSVAKSCLTPCDPMDCSMPPVFHYLMCTELVMLSSHIILCCPLLLPSIFPSIRVFSNELALHIRWPKYWSFNISPSNKYSALISFRIDWFDLLTVQGTLKSLLQLAPFSGLVLGLDPTPFFCIQHKMITWLLGAQHCAK